MHETLLERADRMEPARLHAAFTAAFADYLLGPFDVPLERWPAFLGRQCVALADSRVALRGGELLAFALVAPRPATGRWRLATMGALPAARGSGAAALLLDDFMARARASGMHGVELECFARNERALRLYRGRGFEPVHPLYGHARAAGAAVPAAVPGGVAVDKEEALRWLEACVQDDPDLPLQVTAPSLRALPVALHALALAPHAQLVYSIASGRLTVHSLVDLQRDQRGAEALARQMLRLHPGLPVQVPQLQRPDRGGEALERLGFERMPLYQWLLQKKL